MPTGPRRRIPPLVKRVHVPWGPDEAFRRFTAGLGSWWPLATHSVRPGESVTAGIEGHVGGSVYEEDGAGRRCEWGTVLLWEPPERVAFTWHPGREADSAQEVQLVFQPSEMGTLLTLTHTGWEKLGESAAKYRRAYPLGWSYVLSLYAGRRGPLVRTVDLLTAAGRLFKRFRGASPAPAAQA